MNANEMSDEQLTARVYELRGRERLVLVELLLHLAELDRRRLYLAQGFQSMFAFLTDWLGYASSSAQRRVIAARLIGKFPVIAEHLRDGRLCLTTLCELKDVLEEGNLEQVLARAAGRTENQVKALVVAIQPKPAPTEMVRRLPSRVTAGPAPATAGPAPKPRPEPIAPDQFVLRLVVDNEFIADLDALKALLSHQMPAGQLADVLHHAVRVAREVAERKRLGAGTAPPPPPKSGSRFIPTGVRTEVWRRDEACCAYVAPDGRRCRSTYQLQFHHIHPFAKDGEASVDNISLRCAAHNRFHAEQEQQLLFT